MADDTIGGYRLVKLLGNGQNSQVWEAVELTSHRHFAMKILTGDNAQKKDLREQLFHEAAVGIEMAHPNVIKIVSVDRDKAKPHFIMEFFPAGSVKARLMRKEHDFIKKNLHAILKQTATGLAYMNASGWVHRDIKPDNILVNAATEVRIIDFAIAERIRSGFFAKLFSRKGKVQGTRSYMSPEQIRGEPLDGRADIYSFGITAYELVAGRPPFRGASNQDLLHKHLAEKPLSPRQHNADVTEEFAKLVLRTLEKKREDRPETFHEVLIAMKGIRIYASDAAREA